MIYFCQKDKEMGDTDLVLERTCLEKHPKSEKISFFSGACKPPVNPKILQLDL